MYLNLASSATMDSSLDEAPRGSYMPVSHSLMVCCRVPSFCDISVCVSPICQRKAWMLPASHWFFLFGCFRLMS